MRMGMLRSSNELVFTAPHLDNFVPRGCDTSLCHEVAILPPMSAAMVEMSMMAPMARSRHVLNWAVFSQCFSVW